MGFGQMIPLLLLLLPILAAGQTYYGEYGAHAPVVVTSADPNTSQNTAIG